MQKTTTRFLSLFLCFMMVFTALPQSALSVGATEKVTEGVSENTLPEDTVLENTLTESTESETSAPASEVPAESVSDNSGAKTITASFYDKDQTTLLFKVEMEYSGTARHLNEYLKTDGLLNLVRKGYQIESWYNVDKEKSYRPSKVYNDFSFKKDQTFYAVYSSSPYEYAINYELNKGSFDDSAEPADCFSVDTPTFSLLAPVRKGYIFDGWYLDSAFKNAIKKIKKGTYIDTAEDGTLASYTVYAKWRSAKPAKVSKPKASNNATGKIKVSFKSVAGAEGYELLYATSKSFKKNKASKDLGTKTSTSFSNLKKGQKYYFKVRAYATDSTGKKIYGKYSSAASCKVKKGVKEYTPKRNSGKLQTVAVKGKTNLYVKAKVSKRLKSSDNFYYLVKVDPSTGKVLKQIAKSDKTKTVKFLLPLKDSKGNNHIQGKFGIAVKKGRKYMLISSTSFINNPEDAAAYTKPFPTPASKKGRQGLYDSSLGDKHFFANFNLNTIIGTKSSHQVKYKYNGKTYYFNYPNFYSLSGINADGGTVTVQIMLQYDEKCKDLILPSARTPGAHYYAFNTESKAAREKLEAAFCFLAEQGSQQNCHVDNWILGNEVNTYANMNAKWYYAGNISRNKFIENYASTYRMLYYAVKSNNKNGRVYICCDHTWINRENDWGTKYFTKAFHDEIKSQNKNINWNLAYHAYSAVLTNADFWNDGSLAPNNTNADFVSPKNLEILTDYVKENFGKETRIILSEQGFSYSGGVGSPYNIGRQTGEDVQAAAVAWLYYKAHFNDMIDAVIFSSGDHGGAGYQFDFIGHKAENVYKYMDTPKYATYTKKCLKTIGKSSWKSAVKGFSDKKLKKMPKR